MDMLENTFTLRVAECDLRGAWRPGAILTELQEAAGLHSAALGCGREALLGVGAAWVVSRLALQMDRYPLYGEKITVRTFHGPARHSLFPRFFVLLDGASQVIGKASSLWLLMDLQSRRSLSGDALPVPLPDNGGLSAPLPLPGNIPSVAAAETVFSRVPVYTDLDPNLHVNNARYVDWLCNALGVETMTAYQLRTLTVHYNSEILADQPVELRLRQTEDLVHLLGMRGKTPAFEISGTLVPVSR